MESLLSVDMRHVCQVRCICCYIQARSLYALVYFVLAMALLQDKLDWYYVVVFHFDPPESPTRTRTILMVMLVITGLIGIFNLSKKAHKY